MAGLGLAAAQKNNNKMKLGKGSKYQSKTLAVAVYLALAGGEDVYAACDSAEYFNIPRQSLDAALLTFAQQAKVSIIFPGQKYHDLEANPLIGYYCPGEALSLLLDGLNIVAAIDETGQLIIKGSLPSSEIKKVSEKDKVSEETENTGTGSIKTFLSNLFTGTRNAAEADAAAAISSEIKLEEITVTGSRITRSGMETPTPVTSVNAEQIETLSPDILIEAMTLLPQFLANSSPATVGSLTGPSGSSFLNLRGIGYNRTLVLLDGRRVSPSNRLGAPDIAMLPQSVISNMEIVTGGASAAYGSDAVSGVVNYRLDTGFTGVKASVQYGLTERQDNFRQSWSVTAGQNLGTRGHILLSLENFEAERVESYENRDWYQSWGLIDVNGRSEPWVVAADVRSRLYTAGGLIRLPGSELDRLNFVEGGKVEPFRDGTLVGESTQVGGTGFYGDVANKEADQTGQGSLYPDAERGSAFMYLDFDFTPDYTGFVQFIYGKNDVNFSAHGAHQEQAPWNLTVYRDNAYLPVSITNIMDAEQLDSFPLYRYSSSKDLSRARGIQENETKTITLGVKGDDGNVRVNAYYQFSESTNLFTAQDYPRLDRLYRSMDVVRDPVTQAPVCRSTLSFPDDGCIPANPFGAGTMSEQAIDYILEGDMYRLSKLRQHMFEFTADTEFFDGRRAGPVSVVAGATYRKEIFDQVAGPEEMIRLSVPSAAEAGYKGLSAGFEGPTVLQFTGIVDDSIGGNFDVWEVFSESVIPLLSDKRLVDSLDVNAAMRYANYSGSGGVYAWKVGLDWRIYESLRFRLTRSRDTRAATLAERFDQSRGGTVANDPVTQETVVLSQVLGGNPEVAPELADTWTLGLVFQPGMMPDFALSVDWYDVAIDDYITLLGVQRILDDCYGGAFDLCEQVTRNPETNQIRLVENVYLNVAAARVSGVDVEIAQKIPFSVFNFPGESLNLRLFASYLIEKSFSNYGIPTQDYAGTVDLPKLTATAMLDYRVKDFSLSLTGRYIDERVQYNESQTGGKKLDDNSVSGVFYANMRLGYDVSANTGGRYSIYMNITNLFDRDPPVVATWSGFFGASSFQSGLHDSLGRRYTLGFNVEY